MGKFEMVSIRNAFTMPHWDISSTSRIIGIKILIVCKGGEGAERGRGGEQLTYCNADHLHVRCPFRCAMASKVPMNAKLSSFQGDSVYGARSAASVMQCFPLAALMLLLTVRWHCYL